MDTATWNAPEGSPTSDTGGIFTTVFQNPGPATVLLEACGLGGCTTKTHRLEVVQPLPTIQSVPTRQESDKTRDAAGRWDGLFSLPNCGESTLLTVPPLDKDDYQVIVPLGLLSPPQHVLPTSHIYYHLKGENRDEGVSPTSNPPKVVEIRAPGDVRILGISYTIAYRDGALWYTDYDLLFAPCRDWLFDLLHVSTLNPELRKLQETTEPSRCDDYGSADRRYTYCTAPVLLDITAATVLGTAGGKVSVALDLEAYDLAAAALAFANPRRYLSDLDLDLHVACPFDAFAPRARSEQLDRVGGYDGQPRTVEPVCGQVMQDILGTAQGNWFTSDFEGHVDWEKELALVHHHVDPTRSAISVGGTVMDMGLWLFSAKAQGLVNREFSQVGPDGLVYCYQGGISNQGSGEPEVFPGRLLVKLETSTKMLVEQQDGSCLENPAFVNPTNYHR